MYDKIGIAIIDAKRTPIGKFLGSFKRHSAQELASNVITGMLEASGVFKEDVDEVILGNVVSAGLGQNPARQAAILSGLPQKTRAQTVNKVCGSGLYAVILGINSILTGQSNVVIAGGMESMSYSPHLLFDSRGTKKFGDLDRNTVNSIFDSIENLNLIDSLMHDGLTCPFNKVPMGMLAEKLVERFGITREEQDSFAYESHKKAVQAKESGAFEKEIVKTFDLNFDECPRADTSLEKLSSLSSAFSEHGSVTAGNASSLADGAAALILMSEEKANELELLPIAIIEDYVSVSIDPVWFTLAPVDAVRALLQKTKRDISEYGLIELNEAFSVQALAVIKELGLDPSKVNVNGGAVALGHPIGASGARILVTLVNAMLARQVKRGIATLCIGGGEAIALSIKCFDD